MASCRRQRMRQPESTWSLNMATITVKTLDSCDPLEPQHLNAYTERTADAKGNNVVLNYGNQCLADCPAGRGSESATR